MSVRIRTPMGSVIGSSPLCHLLLGDNETKENRKAVKEYSEVPEDFPVLCFRQCPWYLECVIMYARYSFNGCTRWAAEAELLFLFRI